MMMNDELKGMWKDTVVDYFKILSTYIYKYRESGERREHKNERE
jgi:hypothetical protein